MSRRGEERRRKVKGFMLKLRKVQNGFFGNMAVKLQLRAAFVNVLSGGTLEITFKSQETPFQSLV